MLSSAHDKWSQYQEYVEKNMEKDITDHEEFGTRLIMSGSNETRNLCFNGRRLFVQHWERMVQHNDLYALTVSRALGAVGNNREDPSFSTQYDNMFLSTKKSSFFDINELRKTDIFSQYNGHEYIRNANYVIIAGWDISVTGDFSDLRIKAFDNSGGIARKSKLIASYVMNPSFDKQTDSVYNQAKKVYQILKLFNISAIVVDESGVGKSACSYIKDFMRKDGYFGMSEDNFIPIVFGAKNKVEILEFYYNRIQSGLEQFPPIPKSWEQEETLRNLYINTKDNVSDEACWTRFVCEHSRFARNEMYNDKTGLTEIKFIQSNERWLHDDSIFSSALCSWVLYVNPSIYRFTSGASIVQPKSATFKRTWRR